MAGLLRSFARASVRLALIFACAAPAGCSPTPGLVGQLQDPDVQVRRQAVRALAKMGPAADGAIPGLTSALHDPDSEVRRTAAVALGNMGAKAESALPGLMELLDHKEYATRFSAALAVEKIDPANPAFPTVLIEGMTSGEAGTIAAVGEMGPAAAWAIPHLEKLLTHGDSNVRILAARAIGQIGSASEQV